MMFGVLFSMKRSKENLVEKVVGLAYNIRRRYDNRNLNVGQRNRSKSRGKGKQQDITCYQCGRKGHKKPDCRYYKMGLERKKNVGEKKNKDDKFDATEKANMASNVIIEDQSGEMVMYFVLQVMPS